MNKEERQELELEWRRSKVLELSSQGLTEREIARRMQISNATVHRDLAFLKKQAQEELQHHIHDIVPMEYRRCMVGMKQNLKRILQIADNTTDPRLKLQASAAVTEVYKEIMNLVTNSGIVSDALKHVNQKQKEQINALENKEQQQEEQQKEITEREEEGIY